MSLKKQILSSGIPERVVAAAIFSNHASPMHALDRVVSGRGKLHFDEAKKLAEVLNIRLEDLGEPTWKASTDVRGRLTFTKSPYVATMLHNRCITVVLNTETDKSFQLAHSSNISVSKYVELIEGAISGGKSVETVYFDDGLTKKTETESLDRDISVDSENPCIGAVVFVGGEMTSASVLKEAFESALANVRGVLQQSQTAHYFQWSDTLGFIKKSKNPQND